MEVMGKRADMIGGILAAIVGLEDGKLPAGVVTTGHVGILGQVAVIGLSIVRKGIVGVPAQVVDHGKRIVIVSPDFGMRSGVEERKIAPGHILLHLEVAAQNGLSAPGLILVVKDALKAEQRLRTIGPPLTCLS